MMWLEITDNVDTNISIFRLMKPKVEDKRSQHKPSFFKGLMSGVIRAFLGTNPDKIKERRCDNFNLFFLSNRSQKSVSVWNKLFGILPYDIE
mmetsp:Transcript_91460/g.179136  ORF Transcript_91460/g.179136 Transcript_91460/m.179136 type:complete len:92 (-) Transcript_91460:117-392(-)